ncbi:MAG: PDZ domain-containing protein [Candidatus Nitrosothermus koennekii]|nr:MAG: PDZ domain-containing protein [Candidatus Nitrosothermus koennekii]
MAWMVILVSAKALRLERRGFELKPFMIMYKNHNVEQTLDRIVAISPTAVKVFANIGVVGGAFMMAFALWFLISNLSNFFTAQDQFNEVTLLVPGVTIRSIPSLTYFLLAAPVVLVIHEVAHGIVARLENIRVKSGGFAVIIALIAGFVEPEEESFAKARRISKVRVIAAGSTSNVLFSFIIAGLLIFNPSFGNILELINPDLRSIFYNDPIGVPVIDVMEGYGAEKAGMKADDIIIAINGIETRTPSELANIDLKPGEVATVTILRDGKELTLMVEVMASEDDPERGLLGIIRGAFPYFPPKSSFWIPWPAPVFSFLLWLWMLSFFIGIFNMLPLLILDGEKYITSMVEGKVNRRAFIGIKIFINALGFGLLGANIIATIIKSGFVTI